MSVSDVYNAWHHASPRVVFEAEDTQDLILIRSVSEGHAIGHVFHPIASAPSGAHLQGTQGYLPRASITVFVADKYLQCVYHGLDVHYVLLIALYCIVYSGTWSSVRG